MAFDGIITKTISQELENLSGARIDKIYEPDSNTIILGLYLNQNNYALNICINSQYYSLNLTTHQKQNPKIAPSFCMLLRKYILGMHIKNFITNDLERVVTIELEGFDEVDDIINYKLIIELMGKHGNILLVDSSNTIIDCIRHIYIQDDSNTKTRNLLPHYKYNYPTSDKCSFFEINNYENFKKIIKISNFNEINTNTLVKNIVENINGISKVFIENTIKILNINTINDNTLLDIYNYMQKIIFCEDTTRLELIEINNTKKDYTLIYKENNSPFHLNFFIDDFYYNKITSTAFKNYKDSMLKLILNILNKYNKRLEHMNIKLNECTNMEKYRIYGELITANLYRIDKTNISNIEVENYYDNNKKIIIPLDKKYSPSNNAKRFFKKYNKLKNTLEIVSIQKKETLKELDYIESIIYEIENCENLQDLSDIFEEISENDIFKEFLPKAKIKKSKSKVKKSTLTKNKTVAFNPIKYNIDNYTIFVGRNNKENDYLTLKFAKKNDIWFHTKDIHGSHVILKNENNQKIDEEILTKVASIAAYYSKARNSSNVPVDYCEVKYVKKPNGAKPGMVIYTNNHTLNVNPQI